MKYTRIIQLAVLVLLLCRGAYAGAEAAEDLQGTEAATLEEGTASWEREACAEITGRLVIETALSGEEEPYRMNMLCSAGTMRELKEIRKDILKIIESGDIEYTTAYTAAAYLESAAKADLTGMTGIEERAVKYALEHGRGDRMKMPGSLKTSPRGSGLAAGNTVPAALSSRTKRADEAPHAGKGRRPVKPVNSIGIKAENETGHADYYRQYLYVKDHTGMADDSWTATTSPFVPTAFRSNTRVLNTDQNQIKTAQHKNPAVLHKIKSVKTETRRAGYTSLFTRRKNMIPETECPGLPGENMEVNRSPEKRGRHEGNIKHITQIEKTPFSRGRI